MYTEITKRQREWGEMFISQNSPLYLPFLLRFATPWQSVYWNNHSYHQHLPYWNAMVAKRLFISSFFKFWHCPFYFLSLYSEPLRCHIQMELCACPVVTVFPHLAQGLQCSCDCQFVLFFRGIGCLSILRVVDIFITFFSEGHLKCLYLLFFWDRLLLCSAS